MIDTEESAVAERAGRPDLAVWIKQKLQEAKTASADWRVHARECYDFRAGKQWSDEDAAILREERRPVITFNRISRTINAVIGLEVQNRQEVRYLPREVTDSGFNEMLTDAAKWVRDTCDAEDEESHAFEDLLTCGMGWTETRLDYEDEPDGLIRIEQIDPLEMFWDASSSRKNLADARWIARVKKMADEEIRELWPDYTPGSEGTQWLDEDDEPHDASPPYYDGKEQGKSALKRKEVVHIQWFEKESYHRISANGKVIELSEKDYKKVGKRIEGMGLRHVKQRRKVYKCAYYCQGEILEERDLEVQAGFTWKAMTGMRDRNANSYFGLVSIMMDPQRWANKWLSQTLHIMNSNSKGGLLAELGAFVNQKKAEQEWAKPDSVIMLNQGGLQKVQERAQANFPAGFVNLMEYAIKAIHDTPGVNEELMGLVGHEQAGVLESMRKNAGVTMLASVFDAKRLYSKQHGRILAEFIREYISDGRLVRIVGDAGAEYVPLMRDRVTFDYDVIVDEAPTSHNQKEKVTAVLQAMLPMMAKAGMPPPPPDVIEYLPLPTALVEKWKGATKPDPAKQQADMQFAEAARTTELKAANAKADLDMANAQKAVMDAEAAMLEAQKPVQDGSLELQIAQMKAEIEAAVEIQKAEIQAQTTLAVEQMKLAASVPDTSFTQPVEQMAGDLTAQVAELHKAMHMMMQGVEKAQAPRKKQVKLIHGPDGRVAGAEVMEMMH